MVHRRAGECPGEHALPGDAVVKQAVTGELVCIRKPPDVERLRRDLQVGRPVGAAAAG